MNRARWPLPPRGRRGQVLAGVVLLIMVLLIMVPAMVYWVRQESKSSVADRKNAQAFNLAEAALDRAYWKLKSSTSTWQDARNGVALAGYNFDTVYTDVSGGAYRISISSGPLADEVTVIAEGRDALKRQKRAIKAVFANLTVPGAIISGAGINESGSSIVHWGPMMAIKNIALSGTAANRYFPRKLSKGVVTGTGGNPRDVNGLAPPNTDGLEWWSNYDVPELPQFDFAALRSSAAATGTLNCNGGVPAGPIHTQQIPCGSTCVNCAVTNLYKDARYNAGYVWYWDNNASWSGSNGIKGTVIVRGNLDIAGGDFYVPAPMKIPVNAWQEYQKFDTAASNQYPGDIGLHNNTNYYTLGSCGLTCEGSASGGDLGVEGFLYVGGTINMTGDSDIHGAVWVESGWSGGGNVMVFYDDSIVLPQLNVTLARQSWQEASPSGGNW